MKKQNQGGVMDHLISILKKTETLKSETCLVWDPHGQKGSAPAIYLPAGNWICSSGWDSENKIGRLEMSFYVLTWVVF